MNQTTFTSFINLFPSNVFSYCMDYLTHTCTHFFNYITSRDYSIQPVTVVYHIVFCVIESIPLLRKRLQIIEGGIGIGNRTLSIALKKVCVCVC